MTKANFTKIKKFFSQFPTQKFSKGQIILKPGEKFENVYFIKSGYVRAYTVTPKGENTLNLFKPLFVMSVIHFTTDHRNDYFFQSITSTEVFVVPFSEYKKFNDSDSTITSYVSDFFYGSLLNYFVNQGNIVRGNAENKIASVLLQLTQDYGELKNGKLIVNFPATHRVIANLVGLTRETTSVQMSKLQKSNIISSKRSHFVVNDLEKLKALSLASY
jgi:CRP/FNR family transcriptional regulator